MTVIIAIDPGKTTGIAVMTFTRDAYKLNDVYQWGDPDTVWLKIHALITEWHTKTGEEPTVLCESFEMRPDVISPDETPKYIIKDIDRYIGEEYEIKYQMASQAKTGCAPARGGKPDRLKAFDLYQVGARHSNDAIRHCVVYALNDLKHMPLTLKGWPISGKK
jgi:hypothetical protein